MWILVSLIAVAIAAVFFLDFAAPKTVVKATVIESRFRAERANEGNTLTTIVTEDGQRYSVSRPGRDTLSQGQVVQAEIVRGKVRRLLRD